MLSKILVSEEKFKAIKNNKSLKNYIFRFLLFIAGIKLKSCVALKGNRYACIGDQGEILKLNDTKSNEICDIFKMARE